MLVFLNICGELIGELSLLASLALFYALISQLYEHISRDLHLLLEFLFFTFAVILSLYFDYETSTGISVNGGIIVVAMAYFFNGQIFALMVALIYAAMSVLVFPNDSLFLSFAPLVMVPLLHLFYRRVWRRLQRSSLRFAFSGILNGLLMFVALLLSTEMAEPEMLLLDAALVPSFTLTTLFLGLLLNLSIESRRISRDFSESELRYRHLFTYAPVALWEEDYSDAVEYLLAGDYVSSSQSPEYILNNIDSYFSKIKTISVNNQAVKLAGASNAQELKERAHETLLSGTGPSFLPEIHAILNNEGSSTSFSTLQNLQGQKQYVQIHWKVLPGHEHDYSRVLVSIIDTTEVTQQAIELRENLEHQEMLIREIHHRVRNSLSIAYSILGLQKARFENSDERRIISETQNRIQTLSLIHTRLYQNQMVLAVNLKNYLQELIAVMKYQDGGRYNRLQTDIEELHLHIDQMLPIGLLTCELMSAGIRAMSKLRSVSDLAKPLLSAEIHADISVKKREDTLEYHYTMEWENPGETEDPEIIPRGSLRETLIQSMIQQLKGRSHVKNTRNSFSLRLSAAIQEVEWREGE